MKNLTISILILTVVSLASADLTLTIEGNDYSTADLDGLLIETDGCLDVSAVMANSGICFDIMFTVLSGDLVLDKIPEFDPLFWTTWIGDEYVPLPGNMIRISGGSFTAAPAGTHCFEGLTITGTSGFVQVEEILSDGITVVTSVFEVPEPMTIGLLGLGGLFLRRRK